MNAHRPSGTYGLQPAQPAEQAARLRLTFNTGALSAARRHAGSYNAGSNGRKYWNEVVDLLTKGTK